MSYKPRYLFNVIKNVWGVGGTMDSMPALRSAETLLSRIRAPPRVSRPDIGPVSLKSPCCELAKRKKPNQVKNVQNSSWHNAENRTDEKNRVSSYQLETVAAQQCGRVKKFQP
ncbi:hypothetical protein PoB_004216800 [Plakobranchus ocellatus]|uniref:Uncharacterized protein n=1 Tax=Plakobranchus ocellatus TaxID=259542 RepID=A0AAV4B935_9GAST|nr:hypothetical protein PoB_004216800 [Plakobranchus ocellatus]